MSVFWSFLSSSLQQAAGLILVALVLSDTLVAPIRVCLCTWPVPTRTVSRVFSFLQGLARRLADYCWENHTESSVTLSNLPCFPKEATNSDHFRFSGASLSFHLFYCFLFFWCVCFFFLSFFLFFFPPVTAVLLLSVGEGRKRLKKEKYKYLIQHPVGRGFRRVVIKDQVLGY